MQVRTTEQLFSVFDQTADLLQNELSCTYLEALVETGNNIFHGEILQDSLNDVAKKRLKKEYQTVSLEALSVEKIRRAYQLAILKGMVGSTQPNHQMTPDSIGLLISYLVKKFMGNRETLRILDPAVGTGNLLSTCINHLQEDIQVQSYGVEIDEVLIRLALVGANLQGHHTEFHHQDSLRPLLIDPVDLVVSDLPVGYYPDDEHAKNFELRATNGHSYAHHLFIEQSIRYTKPGGYLFFLIPNHLFETEEAPKLHRYLKEHVYIQSVLQLPPSIFKNNQAAKSIFILQKKADDVKPPKEVLLATLPSLSNKEAVQNLLIKMDLWLEENK